MNFNSYADHQVRHAAELVNRLTPGCAQGRPVAVPASSAGRARAVDEAFAAIGTRRLRSAERDAGLELARRLRAVFEDADAGRAEAVAAQVNAMLEAYSVDPRLSDHDGQAWHLHFTASGAGEVGSWGAAFAVALAVVVASGDLGRLGVCTASQCDRVYVDVSRNGSRRFCSARCMNRAKVAAFRAKRGAAEAR